MKIILVAINSKYSHTNLAVRLLNAYSGYRADVMEFTINEQVSYIISQIFKAKPDVICFSTYIWNIETVLKCCKILKSILTNTKIILGGPEVSYDTEELLKENNFIDAAIFGEGENVFREFLKNSFNFEKTPSVAYRNGDSIKTNPQTEPVDLDDLPFPYTDDELDFLGQKILYYESSRGCPYNCSYCLSSTLHSLRFKNTEKVKRDLLRFIDKNVRIVKFIDRTFNADAERAYEIFKFLIDNKKNTCFHFEISAHILSDKTLELLATAPKGLFQFEIGVQSTNKKTLSAINRNTDFEVLKDNVKKLLLFGNIHLHLDLIAGLPHEDYTSFKKSFNDVFSLRPDMLQLGFLKLLKGTKIRYENKSHGYIFSPYAPYEFLANDYISFDDTLKLKATEAMVDKFYNSGKFKKSIERLTAFFDTPYDMFFSLAEHFENGGYNKISVSQNTLYKILADFIAQNADDITLENLKFDYYQFGRANNAPNWGRKNDISKLRFDLIEENRNTVFKKFRNTPAKEIVKQVIFERFSYNIVSGEKKDCIIAFFKDGEYYII